ncbi:MAG: response regulator transcription factor [Terriglobales bacterium]
MRTPINDPGPGVNVATRILIADDNSVMRHSVGRLLCSHPDWKVCGEAENGEQAVRLARELDPDVLILDFLMPGMNGLEAARQITAVSPRIAIVLCTICLSPQLIDLARALGIAGAVGKDDLSQMIACIEALLKGDSYFFYNHRLV